LQNLTDLKYLRGIDMAIVQSDVLDYAKEQRLLPGLEWSLTYITRLYNEEFHLLAGPASKISPSSPTRRSMSICAAAAHPSPRAAVRSLENPGDVDQRQPGSGA